MQIVISQFHLILRKGVAIRKKKKKKEWKLWTQKKFLWIFILFYSKILNGYSIYSIELYLYTIGTYSEREKMCERIQNLNFINNMIK